MHSDVNHLNWEFIGGVIEINFATVKIRSQRFLAARCDNLEKIYLLVIVKDTVRSTQGFIIIPPYMQQNFESCNFLLALRANNNTCFVAFAHKKMSCMSLPNIMVYIIIPYVRQIPRIILLLFPKLSLRMLFTDRQKGILAAHMERRETLGSVSVWHFTSQLYRTGAIKIIYLLYQKSDDQGYKCRNKLYNKRKQCEFVMKPLLINAGPMEQQNSVNSNSRPHNEDSNVSVIFANSIQKIQKMAAHMERRETLGSIDTFILPEVFSHKIKKSTIGADLMFPAFLFVVVRANINNLGAEINFIEDLLDTLLCNGSLGYMLASLRACYEHILTEKKEPSHLM
ncbi:unnamed protein product, partial [Meganyctiphanes norvegica]